jgi:alpha-L-fucosidase 2
VNVAGVESAHASFWQKFWAQSSVTLPQSPDVEDFWRSAQYLLGSASREGSVATGLWGPWVFTDQSGWQGDFTLDYNYMASYWGTYSSNHVELALPYYVPLIDYYPHGMRSAAAKSCSGLSLPAHIGPWGSAGSTGDAWQGTGAGDWGQNMDGVFSATLFVLHWESTHDVAFLRDMGFEFCRDTLALYQCLMNRTQDGGYINLRDTNGECSFKGYFPGGDNPACMLPNVQYVNSFIRRIAAALPSMAKALGVAVDPQWQDIALHQVPMPSTTINGTDKKIYTMCNTNESIPDPDAPQDLSDQDRLQSSGGTGSMPSLAWCKDPGLNPWTIHPGDGVNLGDGPAALEMARRGFENISAVVGMNNFCSSFNAAVRIGMPVAEILAGFRASTQPCGGKKHPTESSDNADYHPPPPPAPTTCRQSNGIIFQNGGVEMAGAAEFVNSMLMQSVTAHDGSGKVTSMVFPVWDQQQDASFSNLRARGAFLISANFSAKIHQVVSPVTIKSEAGQLCRLVSPWKGEPRNRVEVRDVKTGQAVPVEWEANPSGDDILDFRTNNGASYSVSLLGL